VESVVSRNAMLLSMKALAGREQSDAVPDE
jgi:hypothetical protein